MLGIANSARTSLLRTLPIRWQLIAAFSARSSSNNSATPTARAAEALRTRLGSDEHKKLNSLLEELNPPPTLDSAQVGLVRPFGSIRWKALDSVELDARSRRPLDQSQKLFLPNIKRWASVLPEGSDALAWLEANCALGSIANGELAQDGPVTLYAAQRSKHSVKRLYLSSGRHWDLINHELGKRGVSPDDIERCFYTQPVGLRSTWYDLRRIEVASEGEMKDWVLWIKHHNDSVRIPLEQRSNAIPSSLVVIRRSHWLRVLEGFPGAREMIGRDTSARGFLKGAFAKDGVLKLWEAAVNGYKVILVDRAFLAPLRAKLLELGVPREHIDDTMKLKSAASKSTHTRP